MKQACDEEVEGPPLKKHAMKRLIMKTTSLVHAILIGSPLTRLVFMMCTCGINWTTKETSPKCRTRTLTLFRCGHVRSSVPST
jgi:hypothetical protein